MIGVDGFGSALELGAEDIVVGSCFGSFLLQELGIATHGGQLGLEFLVFGVELRLPVLTLLLLLKTSDQFGLPFLQLLLQRFGLAAL
jgi:hypothetical protein